MDAGAEDAGGVGIRRQTVVETLQGQEWIPLECRAGPRQHILTGYGVYVRTFPAESVWDGSVFANTRGGVDDGGKGVPGEQLGKRYLEPAVDERLAPQPGQYQRQLDGAVKPREAEDGIHRALGKAALHVTAGTHGEFGRRDHGQLMAEDAGQRRERDEQARKGLEMPRVCGVRSPDVRGAGRKPVPGVEQRSRELVQGLSLAVRNIGDRVEEVGRNIEDGVGQADF